MNKRERGMKMTLKTFNNSQFKREREGHFCPNEKVDDAIAYLHKI
jgi:hypothetical protein